MYSLKNKGIIFELFYKGKIKVSHFAKQKCMPQLYYVLPPRLYFGKTILLADALPCKNTFLRTFCLHFCCAKMFNKMFTMIVRIIVLHMHGAEDRIGAFC